MEKVDDFLLDILWEHFTLEEGASSNATAAGNFLLKTEENVISFLNTPDRMELEFPPLNSYYRRILHRLSRRYNLAHRVEVTNIFNSASMLRKVYLTKPVGTDLVGAAPLLKCCEWIEGAVEYSGDIKLAGVIEPKPTKIKTKSPFEPPQEKPKFKILKRQPTATSTDENRCPMCPDGPSSSPLSPGGLSIEEREAKYQAVRDRIFEGFTGADESVEGVQLSVLAVEPVLSEPTEFIHSIQQTAPSAPHLFSPLNPDAIPFDFSLTATSTVTVNHIYLLTSSSSPLSHSALTQILSKFPSASAVIKSRTLPTDSCFLLVKGCEPEIQNVDCEKWVPEFYLD